MGRKGRGGRGNKHTRFKTCGAAHVSGLGLGLGLETSGLCLGLEGLGLETPGLVNITATTVFVFAIPELCEGAEDSEEDLFDLHT